VELRECVEVCACGVGWWSVWAEKCGWREECVWDLEIDTLKFLNPNPKF